MKQLFYFLSAVLGGLALHQTASITQKMGKGWEQLAGPTIGVEGTFPFYLMFLKKLGFSNDKIFKAGLAYQAVFLCVGVGVAAGWVLDTLAGIDRAGSDTVEK